MIQNHVTGKNERACALESLSEILSLKFDLKILNI